MRTGGGHDAQGMLGGALRDVDLDVVRISSGIAQVSGMSSAM
jgi:hypothetical protein